MAKVISPAGQSSEVVELIRAAAPELTDEHWLALSGSLDTTTPFVVGEDGIPLCHASSYLRKRAAGDLHAFSFKRLAENSATAYAFDLAFFLNTYQEPSSPVLSHYAETTDLLQDYVDHLESTDANLQPSTIGRRKLVAREFVTYLCEELKVGQSSVNAQAEALRRTLISDAGQAVSYFATRFVPATRRRSPTLIYILPPDLLKSFFRSFLDPVQRAIAKLIFATGMRRSEVVSLTVKQVMELKPVFPGGPALMTIIGKGNKSRVIELEPDALELLRKILISKERLERLKLAARATLSDPGTTPVFLNQSGAPMSGEAVADAFLRASERCGTKRTPHELRHEFAVHYLLNAYRVLAHALTREHVDAWLARLMIDKTSLAIERLAKLLGHSSSETTKKVYLAALMNSEPSVRDAWCRHLDQLELADRRATRMGWPPMHRCWNRE